MSALSDPKSENPSSFASNCSILSWFSKLFHCWKERKVCYNALCISCWKFRILFRIKEFLKSVRFDNVVEAEKRQVRTFWTFLYMGLLQLFDYNDSVSEGSMVLFQKEKTWRRSVTVNSSKFQHFWITGWKSYWSELCGRYDCDRSSRLSVISVIL